MPRTRSSFLPFLFAAVFTAAAVVYVLPARAQNADNAPAPTQPQANRDAQINPSRHIRVIEEDNGRIVKLQLSSRRFIPAADGNGKGPAVYLTGAVHIADQSFYDALQAFLDSKDVVLFEAVKPPGAGSMKHFDATDEQRVTATKRRIQLLALFIEQYKIRKQEYPADLSRLPDGIEPAMAKMLTGMGFDGWDRPLIYLLNAPPSPPAPPPAPIAPAAEIPVTKPAAQPRGFDLVSLGSDGAPGGDDTAADVRYSDQSPVNVKALAKEDGIQAQLAQAMGLVFQLTAMNHDKPNWRNSDLSVDQVQDRLEMGGGSDDADRLFAMLSGDSFMAKLGGVVLKIVGAIPSLSSSLKMMMVDMLASADKLMENMPGGGGGINMQSFMDVIINDRNKVVIDDLAAIIEAEPGIKTVGVIYGAGHLPDLEDRLVRDLNYRYDSDEWFTAITVDVTDTGMSVKQATSMRKSMKKMIEQQIKAGSKQK